MYSFYKEVMASDWPIKWLLPVTLAFAAIMVIAALLGAATCTVL